MEDSGQVKYDEDIGGYSSDSLIVQALSDLLHTNLQKVLIGFLYLVQQLQVVIFKPSGHNISVSEDDNKDGNFDVSVDFEEFLYEFGGNPIKTPFQDGHYIYAVIAVVEAVHLLIHLILYVYDLENPSNFKKETTTLI